MSDLPIRTPTTQTSAPHPRPHPPNTQQRPTPPDRHPPPRSRAPSDLTSAGTPPARPVQQSHDTPVSTSPRKVPLSTDLPNPGPERPALHIVGAHADRVLSKQHRIAESTHAHPPPPPPDRKSDVSGTSADYR